MFHVAGTRIGFTRAKNTLYSARMEYRLIFFGRKEI